MTLGQLARFWDAQQLTLRFYDFTYFFAQSGQQRLVAAPPSRVHLKLQAGSALACRLMIPLSATRRSWYSSVTCAARLHPRLRFHPLSPDIPFLPTPGGS
ncbi:hypothetical protein JCM11641_005892 [Rhodosporidiobolus odoratus]